MKKAVLSLLCAIFPLKTRRNKTQPVSAANKKKTFPFYTPVIDYGSNNSVVVPDQAVVRQLGSGDKFIYVLNDDNTVSYRKVVLGVRMGTEYEVLEGIEEGQKVVVDGQLRIKDGVKVEVVER